MSTFGSGGFGSGGFGSNPSSSGFGFGKSNNTSVFGSGFGSNNNSSSGSGLFGGNSKNTSGGFGSGGGFGSKPGGTFGSGFGSNNPSGGGLFGGTNNTGSGSGSGSGGGGGGGGGGGFGGFGGTPNNNTTFGSGSGGGGLFGQNKSAGFASTGTTGGPLFVSNTSAFGTSSGGAFGAPASTALSANVGDPPSTAVAAFQPFQEKEGAQNTTQLFQNILFQDVYKKFSAEELRMVDYAQGKRYGNSSGAGAFGVGSGFGSGFASNSNAAFGSTNTGGGLFGNSNTNTSNTGGFGSAAATGGGFGSNSGGGGLFGQNKNTTGGGLFGNTNNSANNSSSAFGSSTAIFGSANSGGGFGSTSNTGGGLFGTNNNNNQNKSGGFGGFGSTNTMGGGFGSTNTSSAFGSNMNTAGGGLFGTNTQQSNTTGGGLFGNTQQQSNNTGTAGFGGSLFGQNNQNQNQNSGSGLFGSSNQQQKPGGLFGSTSNTNTGGGLFGNANNTATGAFGSGNTQNAAGGLFGNKPATGAGALFGTSTTPNTGNNTATSLFGSLAQNAQNQQQSTPGGGLFGSANQNQAKPSLFGSSTAQNPGGGLFGSQNTAGSGGGSLFAGTNSQAQQQQNTAIGSSLFGASQNAAQGTQPQSLTANINDMSAYGSSSLFSNLGGSEVQNPGPLATPLSNKNKSKHSSILPMYKLNPASANRFSTPQKRGGFGFSYSTYGTPGSASSVSSTPSALGQSLLLGSSTRGIKQSVSTSNLRRSFNTEDSILAPGAFSATGQRYGSVKKLVINREMRSDLFSTPQKERSGDATRGSRLRKHVSFEDSGSEASSAPLALPAPNSEPGSNEQNGAASQNGSSSNDSRETVEITKAAAPQAVTASSPQPGDKTPGQYWMRPSLGNINKMSRSERSTLSGFTVGRVNVGSIEFLEPVDVEKVDLDNLFQDIIELVPRSATVYKIHSRKPPAGKGLNVPAKISLEQSWPRNHKKDDSKSSQRLNKHVARLKRIPGTTFIDYNLDTGVWTFRVEHFTTYGLDYNSDDSDAEPTETMTVSSNVLHSGAPTTQVVTEETPSPGFNPDEDTFDFKNRRRALPGAFDHEQLDLGPNSPLDEHNANQSLSSLGDGSVDSPSDKAVLTGSEVKMKEECAVAAGSEIAGTSPSNLIAAQPEYGSPEQEHLSDVVPETPGGIMRARMRAIKDATGPTSMRVADGDDWMDMLHRTISPQKRDRALLKSLRAEDNYDSLRASLRKSPLAARSRMPSDARGFATSIDLMNSLFGKANPSAVESTAKGFVKWPYERQNKACDECDMSPEEQAYHRSMRPTWGPYGTIVFATAPRSLGRSSFRTIEKGGLLSVAKGAVSSEHREIRLGKFSNEYSASALREQIRITRVDRENKGVPAVQPTSVKSIKAFFHEQNARNPASTHEKLVWDLASALFDDVDVPTEMEGVVGAESRLRRQRVSRFWQGLVDDAASRCVTMARSNEEKAIACLSGHRIPEACKHLVGVKNFRLATLVSTIGTNDNARLDMQEQIEQWRDNKCLSEFSEPIRALYALLAGEVHVCPGKDTGPVEERLSTFSMSEKFGLDWKQAFGLRLWYGILVKDDVAAAVSKFESDVKMGEIKPRTWYDEQGIAPIWEDADKVKREDLLWGLLKLYADPDTDLEAVLRPENSQLSPLDFRLTWQLGRALMATGRLSFGLKGNVKADAATMAFATQLVNEGSWMEGAFVLLHLSNPEARTKLLREHLARHAGLIGGEQSETFSTLVKDLKIPAAWVWEAKALYMRAVEQEPAAEVQCLLKAGDFDDAHATFVRRVAPQGIIERDYQAIANLLVQFAGHEGRISQWRQGGEVYRDFLKVVALRNRTGQINPHVVEKLLAGLPAMREIAVGAGGQQQQGGNEDMELNAAVMEMGTIVAKVLIDMGKLGQTHNMSRVLGLPLTEHGYLKHSMDLSLAYYKELMAGGQ